MPLTRSELVVRRAQDLLVRLREEFVARGPDLWAQSRTQGAQQLLFDLSTSDEQQELEVIAYWCGETLNYPPHEHVFALSHINDNAAASWDDVVRFLDAVIERAGAPRTWAKSPVPWIRETRNAA